MRVGSTTSDENATIAEIFASALERRHINVERHIGLGDELNAMAALEHNDIDLYPGFVPSRARVSGITWLNAAPANDSPCLLTSAYAAEQFWLLRLTKCSTIAPRLRLAATPAFLAPGGALDALRRHYGGFDFRAIIKCDPGNQYYALNRGDADVANGATTDPNIAATQLIVLSDDKHFWPERHVAPVVRIAALRAHPHMRAILDRMSRNLNLYALQRLNMRRAVLDMDPRDVAEEFVVQSQ
ncbi:MAG: hypothetical protein JO322_07970 [Candidatus Eremiobacteraeota bacterium]|nr:hypothetical protein [Candidatus Eremiobacteraeota bacterium]